MNAINTCDACTHWKRLTYTEVYVGACGQHVKLFGGSWPACLVL